jgi:hypothetical protein
MNAPHQERLRLDALVATLERRLAALAAEVRAYPTPIARCDDQLPALLARRAMAHEALEAARRLQALLDAMA